MAIASALTRRHLLAQASAVAALSAAPRAWADEQVKLPLNGGPDQRDLSHAFPEKGEMVVQRTRPPLLETPFEVYDKGVFTPNDRFFVRWHLADVPESIDVATFRLKVSGLVEKELSLTLADILAMPRFEIAAVNQCSGNSRGLFQPRVPGGQWGNGAMGNAKWTGVRLRDVLAKAGVKPGAVQVRFNGLDEGALPATPDFIKALDLAHANDGEVMIAYQMNGVQLPLLNGFPLRLVVPGWYSTYWVKMLNEITVLDKVDDNFWMKTAYQIPDVPAANVKPGEKGFKTVPINKMVPRSFITSLASGAKVAGGKAIEVRGIAFGGGSALDAVDFSSDGGVSWEPATLGKDEGKYSFRAWTAPFKPAAGKAVLMVRARNADGQVQPATPIWNGGGFMQNVIESTPITVA